MTPESTHYTGEFPDVPLSILESGAGFVDKMKEAGYCFESDRLHRPREDNPLIEAKNFYLLAQALFYKLKEKDQCGESDDLERMRSFHSIYAHVRQAYLVVLENGKFDGLSFEEMERLYSEVKAYELYSCSMDNEKAKKYLDSLDLNEDAHHHLSRQSALVVYDSLSSVPFSIDGFDVRFFEGVLFDYLKRVLPHLNSLRIVYEHNRFRLNVASDKDLGTYDSRILFSLENSVNLIIGMGEIHNQKLAEGREDLRFEERIELLELFSRLMKDLHDSHPPTNLHNARMRRFWTRLVKDPILSYAPLLHDAGKIGVNDDILAKPTVLNAAERAEIERHPISTAKLLCNVLGVKNFAKFIVLCASHHMNYALESSSYPCYLPGDSIYDCPGVIPSVLGYRSIDEAQQFIDLELDEKDKILIRLFAIVDIIEAITSKNREYRDPEEKNAAIKFIRSKAGHLFEPDVATWMIEQVKAGILDDELVVARGDAVEEIENPLFYFGGDVLDFLAEYRTYFENEHGLNVDADIQKLRNEMNFPNMQLSSQLVRANIYNLLIRRDKSSVLSPKAALELDELYNLFIDWMNTNNKTPKPAKPITVETALASVNDRASRILKAVS